MTDFKIFSKEEIESKKIEINNDIKDTTFMSVFSFMISIGLIITLIVKSYDNFLSKDYIFYIDIENNLVIFIFINTMLTILFSYLTNISKNNFKNFIEINDVNYQEILELNNNKEVKDIIDSVSKMDRKLINQEYNYIKNIASLKKIKQQESNNLNKKII